MLMFYTTLIDAPADQVRFESIYFGYRKQMYTVAFRILRNREDAEDAVQNALLGIARNMASVPASNEAVIRGYVLTAVKNAALSLLPQKQRQDEVLDIAEVCVASEEDLFQRLTESPDYAGIRRDVMIVGRAGQAEIWEAEEFAAFEAENLTSEKLLASLEALGL